MRFIFVCTTIDRGGAEILLLNIASQLVKEHAVTLIYFKGKASLSADFEALGIRPIRLSLKNTIVVFKALWQGPKSILQGWMYHGNILATVLYLLSGARNKLYWSIHHSALAYASDAPLNGLKLRFTALLSRIPNRIIYVSDPTRDEHIKLGYNSENSVVIHNGIDVERFRYNEAAGKSIREKLGIKADDLVLGAVGRNHPIKDYNTFFKAAGLLLKKHPQLHIVVAGRDLVADKFTDQLKTLSTSDMERIHFLGERSDIPAVLSAIDIFALCSLSESFPLSLFEALAMERVCVCSAVIFNAGMFPEAIRTFVPKDYTTMAEHVEYFLSAGKDERENWGKIARLTVLDNYSQEAMIKDFMQLWKGKTPYKEVPRTEQKKKKIIRLISRLNIGGPVIHVTLLTRRFNDAEWQTILVTGLPGVHEGDMSYLAEQYGVKPIILKGMGREISPWNDLVVIWQLIRLFLKEKPDIVHTHASKAGTLGRLAAKITFVPRIYHTFHGHTFEGYFSKRMSRLIINIERLMAHFSTAIIAISEKQREDLVRYRIAPRSKIRVIPLGFDFNRILPIEQNQSLRHQFNIPQDLVIIAIIGRITSIKNHSLFIKTAKEILLQRQDAHFMVIGDGELKHDCIAEVKRLGMSRNFTFTGFIKDLKLIYGSVDIVVLTSLNEGTPVSLLEAMAAEKIVLSTPVGGVQDFVNDGVNGFVCDFDEKLFAARIVSCLDQPEAFAQMRKRASEDVLKKYDKERLFRDIENLYS